ncbi:hypothetical protein AVEN_77554-1 [Araneus ventricosus]|uniref:Uncharacterized protein n=1 Tax=Araneus ventricosus TaxID=182803 RepID=A0A4Y2IAF6_ARAVE|nr:hypothetical protein AVEN_77554-1 [Araneus ventricosus]
MLGEYESFDVDSPATTLCACPTTSYSLKYPHQKLIQLILFVRKECTRKRLKQLTVISRRKTLWRRWSQEWTEVIPRYNDLLQKVRKVVKFFKRSPTKYDMYLQKYVKEDTGKELSLVLDSRTHWNSLLAVIERSHKLKMCIDKALIDKGSDTKFSDLEWSKVKYLIESLQPFKLAVDALCRRDSTLLTAETTLKIILEKLLTQDTMLSVELSEALRVRIKECRTVVAGILIYLQNPKNILMIQDELMIHLLCRKKSYTTRNEKYLRKTYSR